MTRFTGAWVQAAALAAGVWDWSEASWYDGDTGTIHMADGRTYQDPYWRDVTCAPGEST